jgi:hypothetical protein
MYQTRINEYNTTLTNLNAELAVLTDPTVTDGDLKKAFASRVPIVKQHIASTTKMLNAFQAKYNDEEAAENATFTSEQQAIVNTFSNTYKPQVDLLRKMPVEHKNKFFNLYNKANAEQKCCVIKLFFNINQ